MILRHTHMTRSPKSAPSPWSFPAEVHGRVSGHSQFVLDAFLMSLFLGQCGTHFLHPHTIQQPISVNANCVGNKWLNLQPNAHKHNMICKIIRSHGSGQECVHTTGLTSGRRGGGNALSTFFFSAWEFIFSRKEHYVNINIFWTIIWVVSRQN